MKEDADNLRARRDQERAWASLAECEPARRAHLELAAIYSAKLRYVEQAAPRPVG